MSRMKDSDGRLVGAGDRIEFTYGIPGVRVEADVVERDGRLIALTPGHSPAECSLRSLKRHVGNFYHLKGQD